MARHFSPMCFDPQRINIQGHCAFAVSDLRGRLRALQSPFNNGCVELNGRARAAPSTPSDFTRHSSSQDIRKKKTMAGLV